MIANTYIARAGQVAARMVGDELMIMSFRDSSLFSLNATAAVLWNAADGATPLAEIVRRDVCAAFDVDPATALADAHELAVELAKHGIFTLSEAPIAASQEDARR